MEYSSAWQRHKNSKVCMAGCFYCTQEQQAGKPTLNYVSPKFAGNNETPRVVVIKNELHPTKGYRRRTSAVERLVQSRSVSEADRKKQSDDDRDTHRYNQELKRL